MLKYVFAFIVLIHGLIHFMGFVKAFGYGNISQLTKEISKPMGFLWLLTGLLFITTAILMVLNNDSWLFLGTIAVIISQVLIFAVWSDAKYGTVANIIVLVALILSWGSLRFEHTYQVDVEESLQRSEIFSVEMLTEADLAGLPEPVCNYLRYSGAVNKPKVRNMKVVFEGEMRSKKQGWFPFVSEQYNFLDNKTRLFFMKAKMFGIEVPGYHRYVDAKAIMNVKVFGLFFVIGASGDMMNKTETVTLFNDMCLMAPAALIDKGIEWTPIDSLTTKAVFTNNGIAISAILYFNNEGQLINFVSDDRTDVSDMKSYRFSTPVEGYQEVNGVRIISAADAVWHYPDGEFTYGKFRLLEIEYNISDFK